MIESLARKIYYPVYRPYVAEDHIEYFLQKFQSVPSLKKQIAKDFEYYLFLENDQAVGYLGLQIAKQNLTLSKLYFIDSIRGKGHGNFAMNLVNSRLQHHKIDHVDLVVNENNTGAIRFYQRHGFTIRESVTHSFDNGHSVQDLIMVRTDA